MPTYSLDLRPTAPTDTVTLHDVTWAFDDEYEVGTFIDGSPYVVAPDGLTIESQTPAWDTDKNGAMVDPSGTSQGFDNRVNDVSNWGPGLSYSAGVRATFPLVIAGSATPRSVVSCKSAASVEQGNMSNGVSAYSVLTVLQSAPTRPCFRPPYFGTTKPLYHRGSVNYGLLPDLALPGGATEPTWTTTKYLRRVRVEFGSVVANRMIFPADHGDLYPAYDAINIGEVLLGMMLDTGNARMLTDRLIQYAIDMYHVALGGYTTFVANGGFGYGRLVPIVLAGHLLNHTGMKNAAAMTVSYNGHTVRAFGEAGHTSTGDATVGYPSGRPIWGRDHNGETPYANHDLRDLTGAVDAHLIAGPSGLCGAGSTTTNIVLAAPASTVNDTYNDYVLRVDGEYRIISDYIGATRTAVVTALSGAPAENEPWDIMLGGTYQQMTNFVTSHALAIRILGLESTLNYSPFLAFMDRWVDEGVLEDYPGAAGWSDPTQPYGSQFVKDMWAEYR